MLSLFLCASLGVVETGCHHQLNAIKSKLEKQFATAANTFYDQIQSTKPKP